MRSTFHGLNIANMGLFTAQKQIDVSSHNVSNTNTVGFSRQRFVTSAVDPAGYLNQFAPMGRGQVGGGVGTLSLDQIRDRFLDMQYRTESAKSSYWSTRSETMYYVEDIFNGVDSAGLDTIMSEFANSLQELSKNPTDEAIRTNVVAQAKKMIDAFHMYHDQLSELMTQQNSNMVQQAKHVNEILGNIASLNNNIQKFELGGSVANDLRDQRNLLLDELSTFMDITYTEVSHDPPVFNIYGIELTQLNVYVGVNSGEDYADRLLVTHDIAGRLDYGVDENDEVETTYDDNEVANANEIILNGLSIVSPDETSTDFYDLINDEESGLRNGILLSYLNLRDGTGIEDQPQGIPYFITQLDAMVAKLVEEFNNIHSNGYTAPFTNPNGDDSSHSGVNFFDAEGLTAKTIALDAEILMSAFNIAASGVDLDGLVYDETVTMDPDGHANTGNNLNALELYKVLRGTTEDQQLEEGDDSFEGFFKNFLGNLASEVALSNNMRDAQEVLLTSIDTQRLSIMSVSEDEEMSDLIRFQHAYNASARCITTMDEALDKLINGTGRVGLV